MYVPDISSSDSNCSISLSTRRRDIDSTEGFNSVFFISCKNNKQKTNKQINKQTNK